MGIVACSGLGPPSTERPDAVVVFQRLVLG
jgi:hypothetical protein